MADPTAEVRFVLRVPFDYALRGQNAQAQFITLRPPTSRNYRECAALKQAFFRSVPKDVEASASGASGATPEVSAKDVVDVIAASKDVAFDDVLDVARRLFTSGVAQVDGETKLTGTLLDVMDQEDFELMLGTYLVHFTLASTLAAAKTRS
jgi:hypothetical protein